MLSSNDLKLGAVILVFIFSWRCISLLEGIEFGRPLFPSHLHLTLPYPTGAAEDEAREALGKIGRVPWTVTENAAVPCWGNTAP
jgi:hypothetical protein